MPKQTRCCVALYCCLLKANKDKGMIRVVCKNPQPYLILKVGNILICCPINLQYFITLKTLKTKWWFNVQWLKFWYLRMELPNGTHYISHEIVFFSNIIRNPYIWKSNYCVQNIDTQDTIFCTAAICYI